MKILIWSAFAVSLIVNPLVLKAQTESIDEFLGLETEMVPERVGQQKFTTSDFHDSQDLQVVRSNVVKDVAEPVKGQSLSIVQWKGLDPESWLNINTWIEERNQKDQNPDWKLRLRRNEHHELVGKVLQCFGKCYGHRGINKTHIQFLSRLEEGDEIFTEKDSVLWIYLMDGSLVRLAPETSVSLQEINLYSNEIFTLLRLNQGHIYYHHRSKNELKTELAPETDDVSLPLMVRESNQQYFEREIFKKQNDQEHLAEILQLEENAIKAQFDQINALKKENNQKVNVTQQVMIVAPNLTLVSKQTSFDLVHISAGKSYFKRRSSEEGSSLSVYLRGYSNIEEYSISSEKWNEVEVAGRSFSEVTETPGALQILELLTKRIKTMELAREIWFKEFSLPVIQAMSDAKELAIRHGYHQWQEDYFKRINFLAEYTRRIETTHLRSVENLFNKLQKNGKPMVREISADLYHHSLNHYLQGQKNRYNREKMQVKEMTDLQYYVWILRDGKF